MLLKVYSSFLDTALNRCLALLCATVQNHARTHHQPLHKIHLQCTIVRDDELATSDTDAICIHLTTNIRMVSIS